MNRKASHHAEQDQKSGFKALLFFGLVAGSVALAAYTTYVGLVADLKGVVAGLIAASIAMALMYLDLNLRDQHRAGESVAGTLFALILVALIALVGHFNYLYTNLAGPEIARQQIAKAEKVFSESASEGRASLELAVPVQKNLDALYQQIGLLQQQIRSSGNEGYGSFASGHFKEVERLARCLGRPLTSLVEPTGQPVKDALNWVDVEIVGKVNAFADDVRNNSPSVLFAQLAGTLAGEIAVGKDDAIANPRLTAAKVESIRQKTEQLNQLHADSLSRGGTACPAEGQLASASSEEARGWAVPEGQLIDPREGAVGNLGFTLRTVLSGFEPGMAAVAFLLSLALDLLPAIFVVLVMGRPRGPRM